MIVLALLVGGVLGGVAGHKAASDAQAAPADFDQAALSGALQTLRLERDRLRRELDDAAKKRKELEAKLAEIAPAADLGSSLEQAREQLVLLRDELQSARARAEQALADAEQTAKQIAADAQANAQRIVDQAKAEASAYATQAQAAAQQAVSRAEAEAARWRQQAQQAQSEVQSLRNDVKRLNDDVKALNQTIRDLRTLQQLENPFKR